MEEGRGRVGKGERGDERRSVRRGCEGVRRGGGTEVSVGLFDLGDGGKGGRESVS